MYPDPKLKYEYSELFIPDVGGYAFISATQTLHFLEELCTTLNKLAADGWFVIGFPPNGGVILARAKK